MRNYPGIEYKLDLNSPMSDGNINAIESELNKQGFLDNKYVDGWFDLSTEKAVKNYQVANGISPTGIIGKAEWDLIFTETTPGTDDKPDIKVDGNTNGQITNPDGTPVAIGDSNFVSKDEPDKIPEQKYDGSSKHTPYFNQYNTKQLRKTDLEMKIDFGANHPLSKIIKHMYLRSAGIEVDASGNPMYEIFEFVAQDVVETGNEFKSNN